MRCTNLSQIGRMVLLAAASGIPMWVSLGATAGAGEPPVLFEDVSALLGDFEHHSVRFGGDGLGGAAWFDFDNDGDLDLYVTNGKEHANALFENDGKGGFTDIAEAAGVTNGLGNTGVIAADIDNDGLKDLFLTGDGGFYGAGDSPVKLYHNEGGGVFADITEESGVVGGETTLSAAFADIDNDGFLDLFITAPGSLTTLMQHANTLYHNNGDLTFTDISAASGVDTVVGACATFFSDYNGDGWIDLFVANCNDVNFALTPVELFENMGDLTFCEVSADVGLAAGGYWLGVAPADFDLDGDMDVFVTNIANGHRLYSANPDNTYTDISVAAGVRFHEFGWGGAARDLDNDGYPDIFFAGSYPLPPFDIIGAGIGNPGTLLFNNQVGAFKEWTETFPVDLSSRYTSGVAAGDYDNDGFQDLFVAISAWADEPGQPLLVHNLGNGNGAVTIRLEGTASNRDAVGARVEVTAGGMTQLQEIYAGSSVLSMDSQWLTFGLGMQPGTEQISVRWPSGLVETFPNVSAGETVTLVEGGGGDACPGDLDGDGNVGTGDLILLLGSWGDPYGTADLIELLGNWGPCPK